MNAIELHRLLLEQDKIISPGKTPEIGEYPSASNPGIIPDSHNSNTGTNNLTSFLLRWVLVAGAIVLVIYLIHKNLKRKSHQSSSEKDRKRSRG